MICKNYEPRRVKIGPVRTSYIHLLAREKFDGDNGEGKYTMTILVPKAEKDAVAEIVKAIDQAYEEGVSSRWKGKKPPFDKHNLLRDGDGVNRNGDSFGEEFKGHWFLKVKTSKKPNIIDAKGAPLLDEEEIYSGMWVATVVSFYAYDSNGNRGVAAAFDLVKKLKDGERLGGGGTAVSALDEFGEEETQDDF